MRGVLAFLAEVAHRKHPTLAQTYVCESLSAAQQAPAAQGTPPGVITNPPRQWGPDAPLRTGTGSGDTGGDDGNCYAFDVSSDGKTVSNKRLFTDFMVDGVKCGPDHMTVDVDGNLYFSSNAGLGYSGVTIWNPDGKVIGRVRLPEACANLQFGGPKHKQGAHPGN
jgi:hypothetical protein